MPLAAVTWGGSERVVAGSTTARAGRRRGWLTPALRCRPSRSTTQIVVDSEPVPAVAQALLDQTLAGRSKEGVTIELQARPGAPRDVLVHLSEHADLLVVGRRGREGFRGLNLGSVAQHALLGAKCPVAVITGRQE